MGIETVVSAGEANHDISSCFTPETRSRLQEQGYVIFDPRQSASDPFPEELFSTNWHKKDQYAYLKESSGFSCELAFNPDRFLIPESNNKTLAEQLELLKRIETISGVLATPIGIRDLANIINNRGKNMFGDNKNVLTRTSTPFIAGGHIGMGNILGGLSLAIFSSSLRSDSLYMAHVFVPKQEVSAVEREISELLRTT